ncbi:hypothetical protein MTO96_011360 [Rhipicephalus appendiculatus]
MRAPPCVASPVDDVGDDVALPTRDFAAGPTQRDRLLGQGHVTLELDALETTTQRGESAADVETGVA